MVYIMQTICQIRCKVPYLFGKTRPHRWRRETWWWNEHVGEVIIAKRQAFKAWKTGKGIRASYHAAKRIARCAVHHARQEADKEVYKNIDPKSSELYRLANQFRKENKLLQLCTARTAWSESDHVRAVHSCNKW